MSYEDIKTLKSNFAVLNRGGMASCVTWIHSLNFFVKPKVKVVNTELETFYIRNILRYKHIVVNVLKCPDVMDLLELIYNYMQLSERLLMKNKHNERLKEVQDCLEKSISAYEVLTSTIIMRKWRHPKISMLANLNVQALKMFKMSFLLSQSPVTAI